MKRLFSSLWRRIRFFRSYADLQDEMRVNLELQAEENLSRGMTPQEARRQARLRLGDTPSTIEAIRDQQLVTRMESYYRDVVLGLRAIAKSPIFSLIAILTLAIGIGANTAVFTVLYGLLLRSLPVTHPRELALIGLHLDRQRTIPAVPWRMYKLLQARQRSFADLSASYWDSVSMRDAEGVMRQYNAAMITGNTFQILGLQPYLGRLFGPADDLRGGPPEGWPVVLGYRLWRDRFGGDADVIGKQIRVSNAITTIVGVAPPDFDGLWPGEDLSLYLPMQFLPSIMARDDLNSPDSGFFSSVIGRLKPGVSLAAANAEMHVYQKQLLKESVPLEVQQRPDFRRIRIEVISARTGIRTWSDQFLEPFYLMQGLVAIVLLLCCVNVGGLMMSKVHTRQHEFAVRTALGGARWRLIRQYLTESLIIALAGGALGAIAAWYGNGLLLHFFRGPLMFEDPSVRPDSTVFLATGVFAILTTLFFGTLPALRAGRADPGTLLTSRGRVGARRQIAGRAFVPLQVAMSLVLVAVATLLSQSLIRLRGERTGFEVNHVTIQTPPFHRLGLKDDAKLDLYQRMVDRLGQMPGMRSAAVTYYTPLTGDQAMAEFQTADAGAGAESMRMAWNDVGPGYFRTMETKILAGREFQRNERKRDVCVINQSAAAALFPRQSALGQYVRSGDVNEFEQKVSCRVIGIAQDARFASLRDAPPKTVYFPVTVRTGGNLVFLMNADTEADAIAAYRKAITELAPTVPLVLFVTLKEQMDAALGSQRLITIMSNFFAGLALFLSAIGLYGLLSSSVAQRTSEIGVRIALGAQRAVVLRMILSEALGLLGAGVALGAVALLFAVHFVQSMLFGLSAFDPATLLGTAAVLTLVTLCAGMIPALHAASVDPMNALRSE